MKTTKLFAYKLTATQISAGDGNSLPNGSIIWEVDTNSIPTGKTYTATGSGIVEGGSGSSFREWQANTAYSQGQIAVAPSTQGTISAGDLIVRATQGTSGATFSATEASKWTEVADDPDLVKVADVVNNLTSTDTNKPLSAAQGKALQDGKASTTSATTSVAGLMSSTDKTKLDGIASGAEKNVQADWNQSINTEDDFIKNRPSSFTPISHTHAQSDVTSLTTDLAAKQATLVSGTNIKTVNSVSLLGSGDIAITQTITNTALPSLTAGATITASMVLTDYGNKHYAVDATAGNIHIILPTAVGNTGEFIEFTRIDGSVNTVTVYTKFGEIMAGIQTNAVAVALKSLGTLVISSDGANPVMRSWTLPASVSKAWGVSDLATAPTLSMANSSLGSAGVLSDWGGWTQSMTANKPTIVDNIVNGKKIVRFDGSDDYLVATATYTHQSLFFVFKFITGRSATNTKFIFGHPTTYHYHPDASTIGEPTHMHANLKHSGGIRIDGGTAFNPTSANWPDDNFHIAQFVATANVETQHLGGNDRAIAGRYSNTEWAELYGFSAPPTTSDREKLEGLAAARYALTANLPSTHTYKNGYPLVSLATY